MDFDSSKIIVPILAPVLAVLGTWLTLRYNARTAQRKAELDAQTAREANEQSGRSSVLTAELQTLTAAADRHKLEMESLLARMADERKEILAEVRGHREENTKLRRIYFALCEYIQASQQTIRVLLQKKGATPAEVQAIFSGMPDISHLAPDKVFPIHHEPPQS